MRTAALLVLGVSAYIAWCALGIPDVSGLGTGARTGSVAVVAADGRVAATYGGLHGDLADVGGLAPHLVEAVIAIEDRRFRWHPGIDPIGLVRALVANALAGRVVQGGSTLTQQLAKLVFLTPARTVERKVQEMLLAFWLETRLTKDEVLATYLDRAYFGGGAYGILAASRHYFGAYPAELTLPQAAMLAGLLRAPSRLATTRNLGAARARAGLVIDAMERQGRITASEAAAARANPARPGRAAVAGGGARHFADWVVGQVAPSRIRTDEVEVGATLDPVLQAAAERAVRAGTGDIDGAEGALVALAPDGAVLAMVGGRSYARSQFNRAVQARRQPGSAFKVLVYLAALEAGGRPADVLLDAPVEVEGWSPRNWDGRYRGRISLEEAFAHSSNAAAVRLAERTGRGRIIRLARRLGVTSPLSPEPSLALGTSEVSLLELTGALAAVANGGRPVLPYGAVEIRTASEGTVWRRAPPERAPVLGAEAVASARRLLRGVVERGTGRAARLEGATAHGKTGTSQENRDAWFVGFAGGLTTGVWVGRDDGGPLPGVGGGGAPARIWRAFMAEALAAGRGAQ